MLTCARTRLLPVVVLALALIPRTGTACCDFAVLASSGGAISQIPDHAPSIDEDGSVAFKASGSGVTRLLVASEPGAGHREIAAPPQTGSIQLVGSFVEAQVAFTAFNPAFTALVVHRGDGIAPPEFLYEGPEVSSVDPPALNQLGHFPLVLTTNALVVWNGENLVPVFVFDQELGNGQIFDGILPPAPDIDGEGRIAFFASFRSESPSCDDKILLSGTVIPIEIASGGVQRNDCSFRDVSNIVPIASNDLGGVAYVGDFRLPTAETAKAVFADGSVVWEDRIEGFGTSPAPRDVALNDAGTVAFRVVAIGLDGVFTGADPVADKVLAVGDPLCNSSVRDLRFQRFGLNNAGELALRVTLDDNRQLIVRAEPGPAATGACITTVPEPSAVLAPLAALLGIAVARRVARR